MPIRPENRGRYPKNWKEISLAVREKAGWKCEWCGAENYKPHPETGSKVILTVAHINHTPEDVSNENLAALCQKCHLGHDRKIHVNNRRVAQREAAEAAGQTKLFET